MQTEDHAYALVDLRDGYGAYRARLSSHYRRNLNQKARKIAAAGFTVQGVQQTQGLDALDACLARMIRINEASYKLEGRPLADRHRRFLAEVVRRFGASGMLSLPILSIDGTDAAFILGVVERGCFYDITLAYDESFARRVSDAAGAAAARGRRRPYRGVPRRPRVQAPLGHRARATKAGVSVRARPQGGRDALCPFRPAAAVAAPRGNARHLDHIAFLM
jgi:hypothetical protein